MPKMKSAIVKINKMTYVYIFIVEGQMLFVHNQKVQKTL